MMKKIFNIIISLFFIFVFISCEDIAPENLPYTVTMPVFEITEHPGYFTYAGISFNFLNKSIKTVDEITVSFMLFDSKTKENPFIYSNIFEITRLGIILSNENKEVFISLDKFVHIAPTEPYLIDFFRISKIQYTDGSVWQDKNKIYNF